MIRISKIKACDILSFADDSKFVGWEHIPISRYRALSYSSNPRSNPDDIVLYLAFDDAIMVGYRTIMPDHVFVEGKELKVGWLSGNWVLDSHRRRGVASLLLNKALDDWNKSLLYTNYALESKAVYDKSGKFTLLSMNPGKRYYLRSCLSSLLPNRSIFFSKSTIILNAIDVILNLINPLPLIARRIRIDRNITYETLTSPDASILELFEKECEVTPTRRTPRELNWILQFPWLVSAPLRRKDDKRYYFSSNPERFHQMTIKVSRNGLLMGYLLVNIVEDRITIPYSRFSKSDSSLFADIILEQAAKLKVSMITVYDPYLDEALSRRFLFHIFSKRRFQNYYATIEVANKLKGNSITFRPGDGDCAFV
jgi:GNAT superfamily N-acetyltransferase